MINEILPSYILNILKKYDEDLIQEIRLRVDSPIVIIYDSEKIILKNNGIEISINQLELEKIVLKATNYSLYSLQNQIKEGYICLKNGVRIGLGGEFSFDNYNVKSLYCLNIRLPHLIENCSKKIFNFLFENNQVVNTLIIGPPSCGKTTIIRDILLQFDKVYPIHNICVIDERNEISALVDGKASFKVGKFCDIICNKKKEEAMISAIKNLNPDLIVTDEITSENDLIAIQKCINMGVNIIATVHAKNINDTLTNRNLKPLIENKIFKRYIVLGKENKIGEVVEILDENLNKL